MIASVSEMSICKTPKKRQRVTTMDNIEEQIHTSQSISDSKPKYLRVPDQVFKQMLSKSLTGEADNFLQLLDTPEKTQFVPTYAHYLNNLFYWNLEQNYWEHYYNVCSAESIWSSPLEKDIAKGNSLARFKFKTKSRLEKHRRLIVTKLRETENKLHQHLQKPINSLFDMDRLSIVVPAFVRQGQHKLNAAFEHKKLILEFDVNDYRLVQTFYGMNPTLSQVRMC